MHHPTHMRRGSRHEESPEHRWYAELWDILAGETAFCLPDGEWLLDRLASDRDLLP